MWNKLGFGICILLGVLSKVLCDFGASPEVQQLAYDGGVVGIIFVLCFLLFIQTDDKYLWLAGLVFCGMNVANLFLNNFKLTFVHGSSLYLITCLIVYYVKRRKWLS